MVVVRRRSRLHRSSRHSLVSERGMSEGGREWQRREGGGVVVAAAAQHQRRVGLKVYAMGPGA